MQTVKITFWDGSSKSHDFEIRWVAKDLYSRLLETRNKFPDQVKEVSLYDSDTDSLESEGSGRD